MNFPHVKNPPQPSDVIRAQTPSVQKPTPQGKPGFSNQEIAYKIHITKCPTADEFLELLEKGAAELTPKTVDLIRTHILSCTSPDVILSNFPTTKDLEIYKLDQEILARKMKCMVPRIDSQKPIFHALLSYTEFISEPRRRRSFRGFDRDKQNEERIHSEVTTKLNPPESKQPSSIFSKM